MTARADLRLDGCRVEPLASYLKALGVLRLVAGQADRGVTARWDEGRLFLRTDLDADALVAFFAEQYLPSPVVSPWNGGSGFYPKDAQQGIVAIEESGSPRLAAYREAIKVGRGLVGCAEQAPKDAAKAVLIARCRACLSDEAVAWLDAAVVLLDEASDRSSASKGARSNLLAFPPLLGSGGNDGRLDFSNNFMQRLLLLLDLAKAPKGSSPAGWLDGALFGTPCVGVKAPIGQFDPGAAGGPNSAKLGAADSAVNPADFVLMVEGSLLIAAGAARRLGSSSKQAAMPFTFGASPVGYPSAAAEDGRGELWLPVWEAPATAAEIGRLFAEARCLWRGTQARSGLDAARAAVTLGVDRGIDRFVRYAMVTRNGRNTTAVPVGSIAATEHPEVRCLADLDGWLDTVRRQMSPLKDPPHGVTSGLRSVEASMFRAATGGGAGPLLDVLVSASRLDAVIATATGFHERVRPLDLRGEPWSKAITDAAGKDSGLEVRLAACFASLGDAAPKAKQPSETSKPTKPSGLSSLRLLLRPVRLDGGRLAWADRAVVPGLGLRPVLEVLAAAHTRRFVSIDQLPGKPGAEKAVFDHGSWADLHDVAALLEGAADLDRLADLIGAFLLLGRVEPVLPKPLALGRADSFPPVFALLAPFFGGRPPESSGSGTPGSLVGLVPEPTWPAMLGRDTQESVDAVVVAALRRLRHARWRPIAAPSWPLEEPSSTRPVLRTASAVSAALLLRLSPAHRAGLLERIAVRAAEATEPSHASNSHPAPRS